MVKKLSIAVLVTLAAGLVIAALLPRQWRVERQITIEAPPEKIHPLVEDLRAWQRWSVWTKAMDPSVRHIYEGPSTGVGARWKWLGTKLGNGQVELVAADVHEGVRFEARLEDDHVNGYSALRYQPLGAGTVVTWVDEGTLPVVMGGLFRAMVEDELGRAMEESLRGLKRVVEST